MSAVVSEHAGHAIEVADDIEHIQDEFVRRRWTDGLPIIPPTEARVRRMMRSVSMAPGDVIAVLAPGFGAATVQKVAINAVMAGCPDALFPVLVAAVQAIAATEFNLQAIQATTHPVAVLLVVNGPARSALGFNSGMNCLGQGTVANATLGRALRLVMQNVGRAFPGEMDRATHGQPAKYTFCCAENEEASPWASLSAERGFSVEANTVSVIGAAGTINLNTHAKDAGDLIRVLADSMTNPTSNDYWFGGAPWLVMGPEHAAVLASDGLVKQDIQQRLWEQARLRARRMAVRDLERTRFTRREELGDITEDTDLPTSRSPGDIGIVVAGGVGTHSVYVPTFGDSRVVTREFSVL